MCFSSYSFISMRYELSRSMRLAIPMIFSQLIYGISGVLATIFIGSLGKDALVVHALIYGVWVTEILFFIGVLFAVSIMVSQSHGARDNNSIKIIVGQGMMLSIIFTVPMILILKIIPYILVWFNYDSEIIRSGTLYLNALSWVTLPLNILMVLEQFLIGISRTKLVLFMSILSVPIEIFMFYTLILGNLGFPKFGLLGLGYGFTIATIIVVVIIFSYIYFSKDLKQYIFSKEIFKINKDCCIELLYIGFPIGIMQFIEVGLFMMIAFMMAKIGKDILAAYQIIYQTFVFIVMLIRGFVQAMTVRVGYEAGRNDKDALKLAVYVNLIVGLTFSLIVAMIYILFPLKIIGLYIDLSNPIHNDIVHYSITFLGIIAILQMIDCLRWMYIGILQGLKDTQIPMYISLIGFWIIALPLAYFLGFFLHWNAIGIWTGAIVGIAFSTMVLIIRYYYLVNSIDLRSLIMAVE